MCRGIIEGRWHTNPKLFSEKRARSSQVVLVVVSSRRAGASWWDRSRKNSERVPANPSKLHVGEIKDIGISAYFTSNTKQTYTPERLSLLLLISHLKVKQTRREGCGQRCATLNQRLFSASGKKRRPARRIDTKDAKPSTIVWRKRISSTVFRAVVAQPDTIGR